MYGENKIEVLLYLYPRGSIQSSRGLRIPSVTLVFSNLAVIGCNILLHDPNVHIQGPSHISKKCKKK